MSEKEIKIQAKTRPIKYTILVPKDLKLIEIKLLRYVKESKENCFNLMFKEDEENLNDIKRKIQLKDFYVFNLICSSFDLNTDTSKEIEYIIKELGEDVKVLQDVKDILITKNFTNNYNEYVIGTKLRSTLIPRDKNYIYKVGPYKLYKLEHPSSLIISKKSIFIVGLNQICKCIKSLNNEIDYYLKHKQLKYSNTNTIIEDFQFSYEYYKGNYIHPLIIKKYLPFIEELYPRDLSYKLKEIGNTDNFTRKIPMTYAIVLTSKLAYIKDIMSDFVLQDTCNFFGNGFIKQEVEIMEETEAIDKAKEIQDFINIISCSNKVHAYYKMMYNMNLNIEKLKVLKESAMYKLYHAEVKQYSGIKGQVYRNLTSTEAELFYNNPNRVPNGLELNIRTKQLIYTGITKKVTPPTQLITEVRTCIKDIKEQLEAYNKITSKFGFVRCAYTISSTIYKLMLSCFIPSDIKLVKDLRCTEIETAGFAGGMIDNYVQGKINIPLYTLDINSMYPWVMSKFPLPTSVLEYQPNIKFTSLGILLDKAKESQCCIAECRVTIPNDIGISPVPLKYKIDNDSSYDYTYGISIINTLQDNPIYDSINIFPTGSFNVTLCYHTLKYLQELQEEGFDIKVNINEYVIYNSSNYLKEFSEYLFKLRSRVNTLKVSRDIKNSIKTAQVTIFGKFASRQYDILGKRSDMFKTNSFPAVSAHITDASRIHMYKLMRIAGFENVYSINTDGIKVNTEGYKRIKESGQIDFKRKPMGKLKVEALGVYSFQGKAGYEGFWLNNPDKYLDRKRTGGLPDINYKGLTNTLENWYINRFNENVNNIYHSMSYCDVPNNTKYIAQNINFTLTDHINYFRRREYIDNSNVDTLDINHRYYNFDNLEQEMINSIEECRRLCEYKVDGISRDNNVYKNLLNNYQEEIDIEI